MKSLEAARMWLHPGMRVKRWLALAVVGLLVFLAGMGVILQARGGRGETLAVRVADWIIAHVHLGVRPGMLGVLIVALGTGVFLFAFGKLVQSLAHALDPDVGARGLADIVYERRRLTQGRRIVVVGGGTGLSTMLRGLKRYSSNITAVVTVADDGGSSGKIKKQLGILPPGDIRNCLVALADAEPQMTELFQYRFRNNPGAGQEAAPAGDAGSPTPNTQHPAPNAPQFSEGLRDHAFGNLLIAAMAAIHGGDFEQGVRATSRVLNIRGRVLPSTVEHVRLRGEMQDGSVVVGETAIADSPLGIRRVSLLPESPCPAGEVIEAIEQADVIVIGPGSVFTSIIPNLLVKGVPEAVRRSRAKAVYVCNVMTQPGETHGFSAFDHVKAIETHAGRRVFDYVLVNTGRPNPGLLEKYRRTGAVFVEPDVDRIKAAGYRPITGNFLSETDFVRHDTAALAAAIVALMK